VGTRCYECLRSKNRSCEYPPNVFLGMLASISALGCFFETPACNQRALGRVRMIMKDAWACFVTAQERLPDANNEKYSL